MKKYFRVVFVLGVLCLCLGACRKQEVPQTQAPSETRQSGMGEILFPVPETSPAPLETVTLPPLEIPEKPGADYSLPPGEDGIETVADK